MNTTVKIYQLNNNGMEKYGFMHYDFASKHGFNFNDYEHVYTWDVGEVDWCNNDMILDDVFYIFNQEKPEDFKGHSLSVSDIVAVNDEIYYCDSFGWTKLTTKM